MFVYLLFAGYLVLPAFFSPASLATLRRECDRLSAAQSSDAEEWHDRGQCVAEAARLLAAPISVVNVAHSLSFSLGAVLFLPGYVVESMTSGCVAERDPARFCSRAYAQARQQSIQRQCRLTGDAGKAKAASDELEREIATDNAAVCQLLFRHAPLLRIVRSVLDSAGGVAAPATASSSPAVVESHPRVWLFNEQYIAKPPHSHQAEFGWVRRACARSTEGSVRRNDQQLRADLGFVLCVRVFVCVCSLTSTRIEASNSHCTLSPLLALRISHAGSRSMTCTATMARCKWCDKMRCNNGGGGRHTHPVRR